MTVRAKRKAAGESEPRAKVASGENANEHVIDNVLGQNIMGNFRPADLIGAFGDLAAQAVRQPLAVANATVDFWGGLAKLAAGGERLEPAPGDRRFADPAWSESKLHAGLVQAYLALRGSMERYVEKAGLDGETAFLLDQIGDALSPGNYLLGNPVALKRTWESRGKNLARGAKNLAGDVANRRPIPAQVDDTAFEVGRNLAITPGSVVLRTEMFELIQYAPQTDQVHARPILVVPSIVNKYYVFDLAPDRSILEYYVRAGFTVFVMVWRNPQPRHDTWGMDDYRDSIEAAIDAARDITASPDVNLWAVCGAGPVAVSLAGHLAAVGERKINSLLLVVSPLDMAAMAQAPSIGAFVAGDPGVAEAAVKKAARKKRISASEFTLLFAMLRANDLIWNYWISNYLMGDTPPAFDVLYWNGDGTGMTAQFNQDFSAFVEANPFVTPGAMTVRDLPIADLSKLDIDSYVLGAANDHLCIWQSVYRSAQLLGPRSQFVLGNSGHIQTIVCPPGNPKASYNLNPDLSGSAEEWLAGSERHAGSWWDHNVAWTAERAGPMIAAPKTPGNADHPPIADAPGAYVFERG